jgi:hypothetical protein
MSDIFPKWTNRLPLIVVGGLLVVGGGLTAGVWYYFTPKYTRVGYQPLQPVHFSHEIHAGQLGLDCRYCHSTVDQAWYANVPSSSTCLNCHNLILKDDARLALVRDSFKGNQPIPWVQVHKTPDYVYFNHAVHVNRGVSCVSCHGPVNHMDEVRHDKPLSMTFCLDCHRHPENNLRRPEEVYNLDLQIDPETQKTSGQRFVQEWRVNSSQYCSACHR